MDGRFVSIMGLGKMPNQSAYKICKILFSVVLLCGVYLAYALEPPGSQRYGAKPPVLTAIDPPPPLSQFVCRSDLLKRNG